jgi:hypothetical protein
VALTVMIAESAGDQAALQSLFKRMMIEHGARMSHAGLNN